MKILVVTDKLFPDEIGGSCCVAYELVREWQAQENITVDVFTGHPEKKMNDSEFLGNVYRFLNKKNIFKAIKRLNYIIKKQKYDIVVTHSVISWFIYYLATCQMTCESKVFSVFHGPWHKEAYLKYAGQKKMLQKILFVPIMKMIEQLYCMKNERFITLSHYMLEELSKINSIVYQKKHTIIPGGVRKNKYQIKMSKECAREKLEIPSDKIVLFTLRRLDKRMGIDRLIEALKSMKDNDRAKYFLLIGGTGNYRSTLESIAVGVEKSIRFLGYVPDELLPIYFCASDCFITPTLDLEGFGLVNLEALAAGVPVLATPQGGMVELAHQVQGIQLTKENTVASLKAGLLKLQTEIQTVSGEISDFEWDKIANRYLELFKRDFTE